MIANKDNEFIIPKRATFNSVGYDLYTYKDIIIKPNE